MSKKEGKRLGEREKIHDREPWKVKIFSEHKKEELKRNNNKICQQTRKRTKKRTQEKKRCKKVKQ